MNHNIIITILFLGSTVVTCGRYPAEGLDASDQIIDASTDSNTDSNTDASSDDSYCQYGHCPCESNEFNCGDETCVHYLTICDGNDDCSNGFDEQNCDGVELPPMALQPGVIAPWISTFFSNALYNAFEWNLQTPCDSSNVVHKMWENPEFNDSGYPQYLESGSCWQAEIFGHRLEDYYDDTSLAQGRITLTWQGTADIRLTDGSFVVGESSGSETGMLTDGIRVYDFIGPTLHELKIYQMADTNQSSHRDPLTDIKVWLAEPDDPTEVSLIGQRFHPSFIDRLRDENWGFIRVMPWQVTNNNPERDWSERRIPDHVFMSGELNPRYPSDDYDLSSYTGIAYELMIDLCNRNNLDLWLTIPHLATDEYIRKLAQLLQYGSDGVEPYTSPEENPVWPPLFKHLHVYIEYSHELWSGGQSYAQGNWAQDQADALAIERDVWVARKFCDVWSIFLDEFGDSSRLVNVAAVWTIADYYSLDLLDEIATYCPTVTPAVQPDILSPTTNMSNNMAEFIIEQDWFDSNTEESYWSSQAYQEHLEAAFTEWKRRLLYGDALEGFGYYGYGLGGGYFEWLHDAATDMSRFSKHLPIVSYQGSVSLNMGLYEATYGTRGAMAARFAIEMQSQEKIKELIHLHYHMGHSHGLTTSTATALSSVYSVYGQHGLLNGFQQNTSQSPKYSAAREWIDEVQTINHIDHPVGMKPYFTTDYILPAVEVGQGYSQNIEIAGGNGQLTLDIIDSLLVEGLGVQIVTGDPDYVMVSGTPTQADINFIYVMVKDDDQDVARRTFTLKSYGGNGTLVESNFFGDDPAFNLPWDSAYIVDSSNVSWSGWNIGSGITAMSGNNALYVACNADGTERTLDAAITADEYVTATITPLGSLDLRQAQIKFSLYRIGYNSPRGFAVMTSVDGFTSGNEFIVVNDKTAQDQLYEFKFELPNTVAYEAVSAPVELRIYFLQQQWNGMSGLIGLTSFKLTAN